MNLYRFNSEMRSGFGDHEEMMGPNGIGLEYPFENTTYNCTNFGDSCLVQYPLENLCHYHVPDVMGQPVEDGDPIEVPDIPDTCFNYISNLLMEEGSDDRPGATLEDYMAAQVSYNESLDAAFTGESCSLLATQSPLNFSQTNLYCLDDYFSLLSSTPTNNVSKTNVHYSSNFVQTSLLGNTCSSSNSRGSRNDFESGTTRNLPLGSGSLNTLMESHVMEPGPPLCNTGQVSETNRYEQAFNSITNGNWEFSHSVANASNDGIQNQPIQTVSKCDKWNMSTFCNSQLQPALLQSLVMPSNCTSTADQQGINRVVNTQPPKSSRAEIVCNDSTSKTRRRANEEVETSKDETGSSRNKQSAPSNEVFDEMESYGDVLLCPEGRSKPAGLCSTYNKPSNSNSQSSQDTCSQNQGSSAKAPKKLGSKKQVVDLRTLLTRCAQCVARVDLTGSYQLLHEIRQHSSPHGDYLQRVSHYLANGLEARLEGHGYELTRANEIIPPSEILKANRVYVASVPFKIMSYYTTNKTIASLAMEAQSIHIIDFGIFYGLQWPCIIQNLSKRPNGPPKIRITGIDFPQPGFRPAERVEETGRCLAKYCERYNVPFEYHPIAKKWETIQLEELKIEKNEPLVVNCLYRSHNLFDESVEENSPRDLFLSLVRKINPDLFMHGVVNTTSSVPFFLNRFKEAMFHYTALFDLFEATMNREDQERMLLESKVHGKQALNVIACEGTQRVERPESYKQWQVRTQRAGFVIVPMDRQLLRRARAMVRRNFREEFSYDEDGHWVVQGWKGRIMYAISCWKPS